MSETKEDLRGVLLRLSSQDDTRPQSRFFAAFDRRLARYLNHAEDAFIVRRILLLMLTCALGAFANFHFSWILAAVFYAGLFANGEAAGRFMHITCHRRMFSKRVDWLNYVPTWIASYWFGEPPYMFATEHVVNHHAFDNGPRDLSSTLGYRRDSWKDLARYLVSFLAGRSGVYGISRRLIHNQVGVSWRRRFFAGQVLFWCLVAVRLRQDWLATVVLLVLPYVSGQIVNRMNNWTEHAFVNPECPLDPLGNSFTIIGSEFNRGAGFNEGYHGTHHLHPAIPNHLWPTYFRDHIDRYCAADHLVFQGISTNRIFDLLMTRNFRTLADSYVQLPGFTRSREEVIEMLALRASVVIDGAAAVLTAPLGRAQTA
jgi:fatty acid desaturase